MREGKSLIVGHSQNTRAGAGMAAVAQCSAAKGAALGPIPVSIGSQASILRTRRGQTLPLALDGGDTVFIVRSGVLTLQVTLQDSSRQIVAMLFPGDLFRSSFAPPHVDAALVAANSAEVWRIRLAAIEKLAAVDPAIAPYFDSAVASRMARHAESK